MYEDWKMLSFQNVVVDFKGLRSLVRDACFSSSTSFSLVFDTFCFEETTIIDLIRLPKTTKYV